MDTSKVFGNLDHGILLYTTNFYGISSWIATAAMCHKKNDA